MRVDDWEDYPTPVLHAYRQRYRAADGHRHIHGANLGIRVDAYQRAGGFQPVRSDEDVRLVVSLVESGAHIVWSGSNCVVTSARRGARASGGFADYLASLEGSLQSNSTL